ncbi:hypothetical protein B0H12DRAFT_1137093 [Mycena haematopus]|nr:hypothetical protein B0H12DRAFT_1137093 [Mycena haematopus]
MTDVANFFANHPPTIKVGGRRHSISTVRHRPHPLRTEPAPAAAPSVEEPLDYPRPAPPHAAAGDEPIAHVPPPPHNDEEAQRKDKKHDGNERKLMELEKHKAEMTRPTRIPKNNAKGFGAGGRIAQPAKDLHV